MGASDGSFKDPVHHTDLRTHCIGLLLAGGDSTRFGQNKLTQCISGSRIAELAAKALASVCQNSFEAGTGLTDLVQVPGSLGCGPLGAIAKTVHHLRESADFDPRASAIVLAADLPLISPATLHLLADWPGTANVVPVVNGRGQYLAARWSAKALDIALALHQRGVFRVRDALTLTETHWLSYDRWEDSMEFLDVDTPEDLLQVRHSAISGSHQRRSDG